MARGTAITRHALDLGWQPPRKADAATVAAAARAGEAAATAAFARAARALAAGTAATAALIEVDIAVAAGGIAQSGEVFSELLARHLRRYAALPFLRELRALPAELGPDAGLVGAAVLASAGIAPVATAHGSLPLVPPDMTRTFRPWRRRPGTTT
ncbi:MULTISPECIES: ROK family protein [Streptomyces]|uniref:ROK family protein n=1 Tax=Streptomyces TaxID=1883 RepID=UPI0029BFDE3C|nr:ROK family protein [Streptomyces sp. NE06-03C]